jgi:metal-responsive CopG/Arc/MetJ family transcriptional regulator
MGDITMVRINVSLADDLFEELKRAVPDRKRSRFIAESLRASLHRKQAEKLAEEYQAAADEIRRANQEMEGVIGDGLD